MPYAVELFFDAAADAAVRRIWHTLAEHGIAPYLHESANRPHLTLALYEELDLTASDAILARFAASVAAFPVTFAAVGAFPPADEAVVFAAPVVSAHLLDVHARLHALLRDCAMAPNALYVPGRWMPHCSLATHCLPARQVDAFAVCLGLPLPFEARVEEIGVVRTGPARPQVSHSLRSAPDDPAS